MKSVLLATLAVFQGTLALQIQPPGPSTISRQSRILGALLGLHVGDSMGATYEFESHDSIAAHQRQEIASITGGGYFGWEPGHATDDTDLARAVLLAYRDRKPGDDVARLAGENFLRWLTGDWPGRAPNSAPTDIGSATSLGLRRYNETRDPDNAGAGQGQAGNGSLMRCLATGLFQTDRSKLEEESMRISKITHDDVKCTVSCAVYNTIIAELIQGTSANGSVSAGERVAVRLEGDKAGRAVYTALELGRAMDLADMARSGPVGDLEGRAGGYVLETLSLAVTALLDPRDDFQEVITDVILVGGDTDTNAAVAGGFLGAKLGDRAIPNDMTEKVQFGKEFR